MMMVATWHQEPAIAVLVRTRHWAPRPCPAGVAGWRHRFPLCAECRVLSAHIGAGLQLVGGLRRAGGYLMPPHRR